MPKARPIVFNLIGVTIEQFAIVSENSAEVEEYEIDSSVSIKSSPEDYRFGVFCLYKFVSEGSPLVILEVASHFELEEESFVRLKRKGEKHILPKALAARLLTMANDTARGVLVAKLEHTALSDLLIPIDYDYTKALEENEASI